MQNASILIALSLLLGYVQSMGIFNNLQQKERSTMLSCEYWRSLVDPNAKSSPIPDFSKLSDMEAIRGIDCLLELQGNTAPGQFSGALNYNVSQIFPQATVEIDSLFIISAIFHRTWNHADGVALVKPNGELPAPRIAARRAFRYVHRWYERLKSEGIDKLRKTGDEPLKGSGLSWY